MATLDFVAYNFANITLEKTLYIFSAPAPSTAYTYNLPNITCDGMRFMINRVDNTTSSSLAVSTAFNTIFNGSSSVNSVLVKSGEQIGLLSKSNIWYIVTSKSTLVIPRTLTSGTFLGNNGSLFQAFQGTSTNVIVSTMTYPGNNQYNISYFNSVIDVTGTFPVAIYLIRPDGTPVTSTATRVISPTITNSNPPQNYIVTGADIFNNLIPTSETYLRIVINCLGGGPDRFNYYSFGIR
jgi:hypothetical protein